MKVLGIETSCDETAAAVVEDGRKVFSNVVVSQVDIFAAYGGVIPEVAARSHLEAILPVVDKALSDADCEWRDIDAIAVTNAPGLLGSLLIGTLTARVLAVLHGKPLYAVHHLKSHIYANWLLGEETGNLPGGVPDEAGLPRFPLLALVVSGGHTQILYMRRHNDFEIVGTTRDDAVGECFDKVAKIIGLPYPGGPAIAQAATGGDAQRYRFPHPQVEGLDFSFSGLKTAVLRTCQEAVGGDFRTPSYEIAGRLDETQRRDLAAAFQRTAVEILAEKLQRAVRKYPVRSVVVAGGVSANAALRERLGASVFFPEPRYSGDNGAMVAAAAFFEIQEGVKPSDPYAVEVLPRVAIG